MNHGYEDELRAIYRAASAHEGPTHADRRAVRAALITTIAATAQAATASAALGVNAASSGVALGASASALGTKGLVQTLLAGKFLGGLVVGTALGTAVCATAYVVVPNGTSTIVDANPRQQARPMRGAVGIVGEPRALPSHLDADLDARHDPKPDAKLDQFGSPEAAHPLAVSLSPSACGRYDQPKAEDHLWRETEALGRVQAALNGSDPARALLLLREQNVTFASAQLKGSVPCRRMNGTCSGT
jgi:hypothetical protein